MNAIEKQFTADCYALHILLSKSPLLSSMKQQNFKKWRLFLHLRCTLIYSLQKSL